MIGGVNKDPHDGCQKGFFAKGAWTTGVSDFGGESDFGIAGDGPASGDKASPP